MRALWLLLAGIRALLSMNWWQLRAVGNLWVLKVSYASLILVPLLTRHNHVPKLGCLKPPFWGQIR